MKILAYLDQNGFQTITPLTARSRGIKTVYSRHPAGQRLPMYVNRRGDKFWFAYQGERDGLAHTEPESLTHSLCKTVLKELADQHLATELKLTYRTRRQEPIPLVLTSGEFEYAITVDGRKYLIDTFCTFRQDDGNYLRSFECKWQGKIAFEFFHTNSLALNPQKCRDLENIGIPVIQIAAREGDFLYLDEQELLNKSEGEIEEILQAYRQKVRNAFKKQIIGVLFNNAESSAYRHAKKLYQDLENIVSLQNRLAAELEQKEAELQTALSHNQKLNAEQYALLYQMKQIQTELHTAKQSATVSGLPSSQESMSRPSWLKRLFTGFK